MDGGGDEHIVSIVAPSDSSTKLAYDRYTEEIIGFVVEPDCKSYLFRYDRVQTSVELNEIPGHYSNFCNGPYAIEEGDVESSIFLLSANSSENVNNWWFSEGDIGIIRSTHNLTTTRSPGLLHSTYSDEGGMIVIHSAETINQSFPFVRNITFIVVGAMRDSGTTDKSGSGGIGGGESGGAGDGTDGGNGDGSSGGQFETVENDGWFEWLEWPNFDWPSFGGDDGGGGDGDSGDGPSSEPVDITIPFISDIDILDKIADLLANLNLGGVPVVPPIVVLVILLAIRPVRERIFAALFWLWGVLKLVGRKLKVVIEDIDEKLILLWKSLVKSLGPIGRAIEAPFVLFGRTVKFLWNICKAILDSIFKIIEAPFVLFSKLFSSKASSAHLEWDSDNRSVDQRLMDGVKHRETFFDDEQFRPEVAHPDHPESMMEIEEE
jgi:hypothetical protein